MDMHNLITPLIIGAVIILVIFRQFRARRVNRLSFILIPIVGAYEAIRSMPHVLKSNTIIELLVIALLAVIAGIGQAYTTKLEMRDGQLYMKGGVGYFLFWVLLFVGRWTIKYCFEGLDGIRNFGQGEWLIFAGIAIAFGLRSFLLYSRHPEVRSALAQGSRARL